MLKYLMFIVLFSVLSCKSLNTIQETPECPKGYECNTEILKNQSIKLLEDSIGEIYINTKSDDNYHIIKYTYKYKDQANIADDSYVETFYFQVPKDAKNLSLSNKDLSNAKVFTQKSCFCRDAGYELIQQGQLDIQKQKGGYHLKFEYESKRDMKVKAIETQVEL
ncbi:hypothetical protein [Flavobacterium sp. CS20]|uniref:hypothetical protein n=1 Tax=Flavobacterium sp. CS20 TaxID=2775246 RepID=UPI001B3A2802|nr:hypothetical protein [Flavobacterium sp. CS20]QTY27117.1 hypothetical protein IGB25_00450 [Flavobacterium sp. CS20]